MIFISFFLLVNVFLPVFGENCNVEFQKFHDCLDYSKQMTRPNQTLLRHQTNECFAENSCKIPNFPDDSNSVSYLDRSRTKGDKFKQCSEPIQQRAHASLEKCVRRDIEDFTFPKSSNKDNADEHSQITAKFFKQAKQLCSYRVLIRTKKCLQNLLNATISSSQRLMCKAKQDCLSRMSSVCQSQYEMSKKLICKCANDELKPKSLEMEQEFFQCLGKNDTIHVEKHQEMVVFVCQSDDDECD